MGQEFKEAIEYKFEQITGADSHAVSLQDRRDHTRVTDVEWKTFLGTDGKRGSSRCYPKDEEMKKMLQKYGTDYVQYDRTCEPNFTPFAETQVKISDMVNNRDKNFSSANEKLLQTNWAKERGITTKADIEQYMKENKLTWHEKSDGVTMQLVPKEINHFFCHSGGVAEMKKIAASEDAMNEDSLREVGNDLGRYSIQARKVLVSAEESFSVLNYNEMHRTGIKAATDAAVFAGTMSIVQNTYAVIRKDKEVDEAFKDVLYTTAASAATAYVTGAVKSGIAQKLGVPASTGNIDMLATGAVQISKHLLAYASGEIDSHQLMESIAETGAYLTAAYIGKNVGKFVGGGIGAIIGNAVLPGLGGVIGEEVGSQVGKVIGELITSTICAEVISALKFSRNIDKQTAQLRSFCARAEREIRASQRRLKEIINQQNYELLTASNEGFRLIAEAVECNDMSLLKNGILHIGNSFGLEESYLSEGEVTLDNIFVNSDSKIIIS